MLVASRYLVALVLLLTLTIGTYAVPGALARHTDSNGPRTWQVLVGGQSENKAIQAEGYYPHVITIDVGDKVVWTLNTDEPHSVTFFGTCEDFVTASCFQPPLIPCLSSGQLDYIPCSLHTYDGIGIASSGRMIPPSYNWDPAVPHGNTTYSLTFTNPGVDIYFDVSTLGMRGIIIVNPAGTPYPFTQEHYSRQARQELRSDLEAGSEALESFQPLETTAGPGSTQVHHIAVGLTASMFTKATLRPTPHSRVRGAATLTGSVHGLEATITVNVHLSALVPNSVHSLEIRLGVCGAEAPTAGFLALPTFTLNAVTADEDGRGSSTTVLNAPPNSNGPAQFRIPSVGWFINVGSGPTASDSSSPAACGNVVFHNASVQRFLPRALRVNVGDTIIWTENPNGVHSVTFLAGQPIPLIPDYVFTNPTGNATTYNGSSFFDSGRLGPGDSFVLTLTAPGVYPYVDVFESKLGMQGSVTVRPNSTDD